MSMHPVVAIILCGAVEVFLGSLMIERVATNAGLRETTATVISEPEYVVIDHRTRRMWDKEGGYQFNYRYEVGGQAYTGSGWTPEKPGQTTLVYHDAEIPSRSRTMKEKTELIGLAMLLLGGVLVYNALRIDWRGILRRGEA